MRSRTVVYPNVGISKLLVIAFHIPYLVLPISTTTSPPRPGTGTDSTSSTTRSWSPVLDKLARAKYASTSFFSTRPSFPLPGATRAISTPFLRAKWRTEGGARMSDVMSGVVVVVVGLGKGAWLGRGWEENSVLYGSSGCRRRGTSAGDVGVGVGCGDDVDDDDDGAGGGGGGTTESLWLLF